MLKSRLCILLVATLSLLLGARLRAADDEPSASSRIVVKFKASLAQELERALPTSLELADPARHVRPDLFGSLGVQNLKPLHPQLVREKKQRGASEDVVAATTKRKFARRTQRVTSRVALPELSRTFVLDLTGVSDPQFTAAVEFLRKHSEVEFAEPELLRPLQFTPNDTYFGTSGSWGQGYQDLWGLHRVQAPTAWDAVTGQGVIVAVVDTGVDANHPDLTANLWVNTEEIPANGLDDDGNGFIDDVKGWDFVGASWLNPMPDNNPADVNGHGTHVSGIVAATGNNAAGVVGLAWGAQVMALRGFDNANNGSVVVLANAIVYAANNGADVINCSFGGPGYTQVERDAIDYAHGLGCVVVAASGNDGIRVEDFYPALFPSVITVGASSPADLRSSFANWGSRIDVMAPGEDILSLRAAGTTPGTPLNASYTRWGGTSMAAPHVSALAALILSQLPSLSPEQVRQVLRLCADDIEASGWDVLAGFGRINAATALAIPAPLEAKIQSPFDGVVVDGILSFTGVAQGTGFASFDLEYGVGESPGVWNSIAQGAAPVNGGVLGAFEPDLPDGRHSIRLTVRDGSGGVYVDRMSFNVRYASITSPLAPPIPSAAQTYKAGSPVTIYGSARGLTFSQFRVEWARGNNPASGWTSTGVTLVGGGLTRITNSALATMDTSSVTQADWYTVRMFVETAGFTNEVRTLIYLEPQLLSADWPRLLQWAPSRWAGVVPARDAAGATRFVSVGGGYLLQVIAADGSSAIDVPMLSNSSFQPAAANLDGAPGDEIIVATGGSLRIFRPDLSYVAFTPAQTVNFAYSRVVVEDLNNDGTPEILLTGISPTTADAYLYAFKTNGQQLTGNYPIHLTDSNSFQRTGTPMRFLTVDLNNDGLKETLVVECPVWTNAVLRAFHWDGTPYPWPTMNFGTVDEIMAGDFDRDGSVDVAITGRNRFSHGYWLMLNADGSLKPGWPQTTGLTLSSGARMVIADLNRDGQDELVTSSIHKVFAFKPDGTQLSAAWPIACPGAENLSVGDVDNDGFPEVWTVRSDWSPITQFNDFKLLTVRASGVTNRVWRLTGRDGMALNAFTYAPVLGDFDGNGSLDAAATYAIGNSGYGLATVVDADSPFNAAAMDWPLTFHDARNTATAIPAGSAPSIALVAPADAALVSGTIQLQATASDDLGVIGVQFQVDGANVGSEIAAPPYTLDWNSGTVANGLHQIAAVARDGNGHITKSAVSAMVTNDLLAPAVSISSPTNLARVGGTFTVSASASDNVGVVGVQFRVDGVNVGAEDLTAPYSVSWNSTEVAIGAYALTAVARDAAGNMSTSAVVTVTVTNVVKVNFQPAAAPTYPGYFVESGETYGPRANGYSHGWNASNTANTLDRNAANSPDQRYDTLSTMQVGGTFTWEIGVPNGRYSVRVVAGDPNFYNSNYKINVEGVLTVNAAPKNNQRWKEGTSTVTVSDGRITISNATGANNNKICFLEITPVP